MTTANDVWFFPMVAWTTCRKKINRIRLRNEDHQYYIPKNEKQKNIQDIHV